MHSDTFSTPSAVASQILPKEEDKVNKMTGMRTRVEILKTFQNLLLALPRPFKEGKQG
jgi:hypothetical protein